MPVVGFGFTSITAKSTEEGGASEIKIDSSPRITDVKTKELNNMPGKIVFIEFVFNTSYEPDMGEIKFRGNVIYQSTDPDAVVKKWEDEKVLDDSLVVEVMNMIFRRCLTKAIDLSQELRLPPPIQFPKVLPKGDKESSE